MLRGSKLMVIIIYKYYWSILIDLFNIYFYRYFPRGVYN